MDGGRRVASTGDLASNLENRSDYYFNIQSKFVAS